MSKLVTVDVDQLDTEIEATRRKLAHLEAARSAVLAFGRPHSTSNGTPSGHDAAPALSQEDVAGLKLYEAAAQILRKIGRPLKTPEIVAYLKALGIGADAVNLQTATFTAMTRKPEMFEKAGPGLWQLKE